jgi:hypothetical protein
VCTYVRLQVRLIKPLEADGTLLPRDKSTLREAVKAGDFSVVERDGTVVSARHRDMISLLPLPLPLTDPRARGLTDMCGGLIGLCLQIACASLTLFKDQPPPGSPASLDDPALPAGETQRGDYVAEVGCIGEPHDLDRQTDR